MFVGWLKIKDYVISLFEVDKIVNKFWLFNK